MYKAKKETKRWLRALEIAKTVFWAEGYHTRYLEEMEDFIRREKMYSPKINPELVQRLYKLAKLRKVPMTRVVNGIVADYFKRNPPAGGEEIVVSEATVVKYK